MALIKLSLLDPLIHYISARSGFCIEYLEGMYLDWDEPESRKTYQFDELKDDELIIQYICSQVFIEPVSKIKQAGGLG